MVIIFSLALVCCGADSEENSVEKAADNAVIVDASGELASSDTAVLGPPTVKAMWQFKITFLAPEGMEVKKDQPVVGFDPSKLRQNLSVKSSELKTAKKSLANTRLTNEAALEKQKLQLAELLMKQQKSKRKWQQSKGLESNIETQKLEIEFQLAKNEVRRLERILKKSTESNKINISISTNKVARLENEVKQMKFDITRLTIKAPKPGIVIYKADHQGNKVSTGDSVWMGRQVVELPSLKNMIVKATILEADAGKVKVGQQVEITLDAAPERIFKGEVKKLGRIFRRKNPRQPNIIFDAEIKLLDSDAELMRPGMAARLKIHAVQSVSSSLAVVDGVD